MAAPPESPALIVVTWDGGADERARAEALGARRGLDVVEDPGDAMCLVVCPNGLELREDVRAKGVRASFAKLRGARGDWGQSRKQPLGRAIGRQARTVVDATAGLGQDAVLLALMGCRVTAIERAPAVAALLEDGLARLRDDPTFPAAAAGRLTVVCGDARHVLAELPEPPDAVYIDPMFPPRRKASALAPKRIRLVRTAVGVDEDAPALLAAARSASPRVVVKRPHEALPLAADAAFTIAAKLVRYYVYVQS